MLGQKLSAAMASRDMGKIAAALDENWRMVYELADAIAERHVQSASGGATFIEPIVERLEGAATGFDARWKEKPLKCHESGEREGLTVSV